jgi:hypothetical protein
LVSPLGSSSHSIGSRTDDFYSACSQQTIVASIKYTDVYGSVRSTGAIASATVSGSGATITQAYGVHNTAIKPGSPVTVAYYSKKYYFFTDLITSYTYTHSALTTTVNVKATTTVPVTVTNTATSSSTATSTSTVHVPQQTTLKPCTVGTVTNTADVRTVTATSYTKPDAETVTKTVPSTKVDTITETKVKTLPQHTSKMPCTYGTLTKTGRPSKTTVYSTITADPSTKTTYVHETETETRWSTRTVEQYGETTYEQCTKGTKTKYAPTYTKDEGCTITPYPVETTKVKVKHVTTKLSCISENLKARRSLEEGLEERNYLPYGDYWQPDCNPKMTTYTTGTTTVVNTVTTSTTTTAVRTETTTESDFPNPPTTTLCANAYATTTVSPTTTTTVYKPSSVTETSTQTSVSTIYQTRTATTVSKQTPSPATTTVCKSVQATATSNPTITVTRYIREPRKTETVTGTLTRTRTVVSHTTKLVGQTSPVTLCHWIQATTTVTPTQSAGGKCTTLDRPTHTKTTVVKVTETVYSDKHPTPCPY